METCKKTTAKMTSNSLVVDIVQESATDSNEENYFAVADDPNFSERKSDSFSVFPAIFVQTKVTKPHSKVNYVIRLSQNQLLRAALNLRMLQVQVASYPVAHKIVYTTRLLMN